MNSGEPLQEDCGAESPAAAHLQAEQIETPDGRSRRRDHNAAMLYEAADRLLATRTFEDVSVEEICEKANVGRATFFRIFETKAGLLREFNRRLAADAADRIERAGPVDLRGALELVRQAMISAWQHTGRGHVGMAQEFVRSVPAGDPHAAHPELLAVVTERIGAAIGAGQLADTVPADLLASLALITMTAPIAYAIAGRDVDIDHLSRTLLDQWYAGLAVQ